jgi:hypothetical protein
VYPTKKKEEDTEEREEWWNAKYQHSIKNKIIMSPISIVCFLILITKSLLILIGLYVRGYGWLLKTVKQSKKTSWLTISSLMI